MGEPPKRKSEHISFTSARRFGIELEVNSFDGENRPPKGQKPAGIEHVATLVAHASPEEGCEIREYEHTGSDNNCWVAKMDSSCGMEVVSPPLKGWNGLKKVLQVSYALKKDSKVNADHRCSVHVHIEIADLSTEQLANIVAWWVKCEPVIMDSMPMERKRNRYCQLIGMNNIFQHNGKYSDQEIVHLVGTEKYYSMNTHQYVQSNRKTIEFRTIEAAGCKNPYLIKQWVRFIIHFVETAAKTKRPGAYREPTNDHDRYEITPWTGMGWLDPEHVLTFLGFNNKPASIPEIRPAKEYTLSNGMQQTRNWFLARLMKYMSRHKPGGLRYYAFQQLQEVLDREKALGNEIDVERYLSPEELGDDLLFGDQYRI